MSILDDFLNSISKTMGVSKGSTNDPEKSKKDLIKSNKESDRVKKARAEVTKEAVLRSPKLFGEPFATSTAAPSIADMANVAEAGIDPRLLTNEGFLELPTEKAEPPKQAQLSEKAKKEAKEIPAKKSQGMSNMFAQALGGALPLLIGTALGGVEGGAAAGDELIAARERERKAALEQAKLEQGDRLLNIKEQVATNQLLKLNAEANPTLQNRLKDLSGEDKKSLGNVMDARQAILDMNSAMKRGINKFSPVGDNLYTEARTRFVESIARLKSGAAISEKEFDIYTGMTPSTVDERNVVKRKMDRILSSVDQRFEILGFDPNEFEFKMDSVATALDSVTRDQILAEKARRQQGQ